MNPLDQLNEESQRSRLLGGTRIFHLFILLSISQFLVTFYVSGFFNTSVYILDDGSIIDPALNYSLVISIFLLAIWLTYFLLRKKLVSAKWVWYHLCVSSLVVFLLPWIILEFFGSRAPARYYSYERDLFDTYMEDMKYPLFAASLLLLLSGFFLLFNIRSKMKMREVI